MTGVERFVKGGGSTVAAFPAAVMQSGRYYRLPNGTVGTSAALVTNTFRATPKYVPSATTLSRLGAEVATIGDVGSKFRIGIYADDGTFRPGTLVLDAGQIAGDSGTVQEIVVNQALAAGWYWFGGVVQVVTVTQPTMRTITTPTEPAPVDYGTTIPGAGVNGYGFTMTGVSGALPGTFTVAAPAAIVPSIFGKVA